MKDLICDEFQNTVGELLIRHQSILDVLSKSQEASSRVNRAVTKAVTSCGCLKIKAEKNPFPKDATFEDLKNFMNSHLEGQLCESCKEIIERELGRSLFYMAALCNHLDLNMYDAFVKEQKKLTTLRFFNFT